jgi:rare lipoprotein A
VRALLRLSALLLAIALLTGCGGHKRRTTRMPAPPPTIATVPAPPPRTTTPSTPSRNEKVIYTETGYASWYGPPYHNRKAANGEIYDQDALTAAHRTLPFGSRVRVTNLKTGESVVVTITDRGPFVENRIIDLSRAAAKAVNVWRPGTAKVRLDVLDAPADIAHGGRWCVQIGAFPDYGTAAELKQELKDRYATAKVIQFTGPTGEWVRVRVPKDDKRQAEEVADSTHTSAPVWLVRMD